MSPVQIDTQRPQPTLFNMSPPTKYGPTSTSTRPVTAESPAANNDAASNTPPSAQSTANATSTAPTTTDHWSLQNPLPVQIVSTIAAQQYPCGQGLFLTLIGHRARCKAAIIVTATL